jgi:hypothetical protein
VPPLSHLTSCTPTESNLYYDIPCTTVLSEPAPYRFLAFHEPNIVYIFLSFTSEGGAKIHVVQGTNVEKSVSRATMTCFSANEDFVQLFVIFKVKRNKQQFCAAMLHGELVEISEIVCISWKLFSSGSNTFTYTHFLDLIFVSWMVTAVILAMEEHTPLTSTCSPYHPEQLTSCSH